MIFQRETVDMNYTSELNLPRLIKSTFPSSTSSLPSSPPAELYTMMGIWASATGVLGVVANLTAVGVFFKVKKVNYSNSQIIKNNHFLI